MATKTLTDGERMIWAAAFARALENGSRGHAIHVANDEIEALRRINENYQCNEGPWAMLRDMLGEGDPEKQARLDAIANREMEALRLPCPTCDGDREICIDACVPVGDEVMERWTTCPTCHGTGKAERYTCYGCRKTVHGAEMHLRGGMTFCPKCFAHLDKAGKPAETTREKRSCSVPMMQCLTCEHDPVCCHAMDKGRCRSWEPRSTGKAGGDDD